MNLLVKVTFFLIVVFCSNSAFAQSGPPVCKILYGYDKSGNRIKREYKCVNSWLPGDPILWNDNHDILISVFPNPTTGVITGTFTVPIGGEAGGAYVTITTMGGIVVFEQQYNEIMSSITMDISQQIPGQYLLTIAAFNKVESHIITKL